MVVNCPLPQFPHSHRAVVDKIINFRSTTIRSLPSPEETLAKHRLLCCCLALTVSAPRPQGPAHTKRYVY